MMEIDDPILDYAIEYKQKGTYPTSIKEKKRAVRKRAKTLIVENGEVYLQPNNRRVKIITSAAEQSHIMKEIEYYQQLTSSYKRNIYVYSYLPHSDFFHHGHSPHCDIRSREWIQQPAKPWADAHCQALWRCMTVCQLSSPCWCSASKRRQWLWFVIVFTTTSLCMRDDPHIQAYS